MRLSWFKRSKKEGVKQLTLSPPVPTLLLEDKRVTEDKLLEIKFRKGRVAGPYVVAKFDDEYKTTKLTFQLVEDAVLAVNQITLLDLGWSLDIPPGVFGQLTLALDDLPRNRFQNFPDQRFSRPEEGITLLSASLLFPGKHDLSLQVSRTLNYVNTGERVLLKKGDTIATLTFPFYLKVINADEEEASHA